jgi:hypothetical protein
VHKFLKVLFILSAGLTKPNPAEGKTKPKPAQTCTFDATQTAFTRGVNRAFDKLHLPSYVRFAFMANAEHESKMRVRAVSAPNLPDHKSGGSHTAYQILKPNLTRTLLKLDLRWSDVVPPKANLTLDEVEHYAEVQTNTAFELTRTMGLRWPQTKTPETVVLNYFSRWAAGAWPWSRVKAQAQVAEALKDGIPTSNADLWALARRLESQGRLIASSALYKLLLYRQFQTGCLLSG